MRRVGAIPPIVTVLITIAAVVAASLVAWFMWTTTKSATGQLLLEAKNAYTPDGQRIFFTLNNIGTQEIEVRNVIANCSVTSTSGTSTSYSGTGTCISSQSSAQVKAGQSAACSVALNGAFTSGDPTCSVTIVTDKGSAILAIRAARG